MNDVLSIKTKAYKNANEKKSHALIQCVQTSTTDSVTDWTFVWQQMQSLGFKECFNENICKSLFNQLIDRYIGVKRSLKNLEGNVRQVYEMPFHELNESDLTLFYDQKTLKKVLNCRKHITKVTVNKGAINGKQTQVKQTKNEPKVLKPNESANNNIRVFNRKVNSSPNVSTNNVNKIPVKQQLDTKHKEIVEHLPKEVKQLPENNEKTGQSPSSLSTLARVSFMTTLANQMKCLTDEDKALIGSEPTLFWEQLANKMVNEFKFQEMNANQCKERFSQMIDKYLDVLKSAKSSKAARNQLLYFEDLHSIDLSLFVDSMTSQLIGCLKHKLGFDAKKSSPKAMSLNANQTDKESKPEDKDKDKSTAEPTNSLQNNSQNNTQKGYNRREKSYFVKIPINYKRLTQREALYYAQLSRDPNFIQLLKTGSIDDKALTGDILNCSTIEDQINVFRRHVLLSREDIVKRLRLKDIFEEIVNNSGIQCVFHFFGSTANSVGFRNSDIDLFIDIKGLDNIFVKYDYNTYMSYLTVIKNIFRDSLKFFIPAPVPSIRCPIIKIDFKFYGEKFRNNPRLYHSLEALGIGCDINLSNGLGLQNTKLISFYCELDSRFQDLAIILRYWAKNNGFIGGSDNAFTSYALTQLVIFFCQNLSPPMLPTVDQLREPMSQSIVIDGWECGFCDNKNLIVRSQNTESVIDLLPKFFKFYSEFNFTTHVIQLKSGKAVHKQAFNEVIETTLNTKRSDVLHFKMTSFCCIEDPFNLEHNLTANLNFAVFDKFLTYIKAIASKADSIFARNKSDSDMFGISQIITEFDPTDGSFQSIAGHFVCLPNPRTCVELADITSQEIIKSFANQAQLVAKYDIIFGSYSPFAEFCMDLKAIDIHVIDNNNRDHIRRQLSHIALNRSNKEEVITNEIITTFSDKLLPQMSISCRFVVLCNARPSGPYIDYELIESNPELKLTKNFLRPVFDLLPKLIDESY
ncbi:unnamed protein product [Oppiella nova]|uniref:Uncharacterized protein n=1 Tax=Oppiella nova TaxID=334625 RepID=A0A7R9QNW0_9ACAR|nr:unnamed protein product [Oppiella nova]CAG2168973.1 unnamed protein product [Oppiella nova]